MSPIPLLMPSLPVRLAARIDHFQGRGRTGAMAQARQLDAANMVEGQVRDVDVEHCARRQVQGPVGLHQLAGEIRRRRQVIQLP